jgi:Kef-type K+ transport system membrane component KefB
MSYLSERNILIFLVQFFLLLGLARGLGELFRKIKQPSLTAEILVGVLLGPTIFGRFMPDLFYRVFPQDAIQLNMLETVSWLGLLFFLLVVGLEVDFSSAWRQRGDALKIAITDIVLPLAISIVPWLLIPDSYLVNPQQRFVFALFMATAMTISAMAISARALQDLGVLKTDLGLLIMSALSVNDMIGWLIFTMVISLFVTTAPNIAHILMIFAATIGFAVFCLTLGRTWSSRIIDKINEKQMPEPATSLTFICLVGLVCGAVTQRLGIQALFGFFVAGMMVGGAKSLSEKTRQTISQMVFAVFVPLYFAGIGLRLDFFRNFNLFLVVIVSVIGILARFAGAWLGVNFTTQSKSNRLSIAIAHTPGGPMQIVLGMLAWQYHLISEPVFVAIICGAVISSIALGPWLSHSIRNRKEISILEFFARNAILPDLKAGERDVAIYELCEMAAEQENLPLVEPLYQAVIKREEILGTAMEMGVAVPHARLDIVKKPLVVLGRSRSGIEWNSADGKPSYFIFLILTPLSDDEAQIQLLASIAKMMVNFKNGQLIMEAKDQDEIWAVLQGALSERMVKKR